MEYKKLNNGIEMPMVGLGVYNIPERETQRVVEDAISVGYRSIDTAAMYYNERGVGDGVWAWLLKKIHANGRPDYPEREEWQGMNFIR